MVCEHLTLRSRILEVRLVSKAFLLQMDRMGTGCLTLHFIAASPRWVDDESAIDCATPGYIGQFQPQRLHLMNMSSLEVCQVQRLLSEARCLTTLTVHKWAPCFTAPLADFRICQAFKHASEVKHLRWENPDISLALTLRIICDFQKLVSLRLMLSGLREDHELLPLQSLRVLPLLRELFLEEQLADHGCHPDRNSSWIEYWFLRDMYTDGPAVPLAVALSPLRNLQILDWGEVPVWEEAVPAVVCLLQCLTLLSELKTIMFCREEL